MGLTHVAIVRPVFMLMVITALVILGLVAFSRLNAELYPSLNIPAATVVTNYPGAAPDDVERLITRPIEDAVAGVPNVDTLVSTSTEGSSQVQITFSDSANPDVAATDVERRVSAIRGSLPIDATAPSVLKFDTSQISVLDLAYAGNLSLDELFRIADDQIKPRLETQSGVAQVSIAGGLEREIQVQVNPARLRAYGLTLEQVQQALDRENQGLPGGTLERGSQQENLRLYGLFQSVDELRDLTVATTGSGTVRLADLAQVIDTTKRVTSRTFFNGREAVSLSWCLRRSPSCPGWSAATSGSLAWSSSRPPCCRCLSPSP